MKLKIDQTKGLPFPIGCKLLNVVFDNCNGGSKILAADRYRYCKIVAIIPLLTTC